MKRLATLILIAFISIAPCWTAGGLANGQMSKTVDWKDKIFVGGNLGATFGTITNVNISPMIGYKFTPKTIAGITMTYQYFRQQFSGGGEYKTNIYGGGLFARQYLFDDPVGPFDNIFLHGEYEGLNFAAFNPLTTKEEREWLFTGLLGGGVQSGFFTITALYILNHDPNNSPYGAAPYVVRVGVGF